MITATKTAQIPTATVPRETLVAALAVCDRFAPSKGASRISWNIRLLARPNDVAIEATSGSRTIRVPLSGAESGDWFSVLICGGHLGVVARETAGDRIEIAYYAERRRVEVVAGSSWFALVADDPTGYPEEDSAVQGPRTEVKAGDLARAFRSTMFAATLVPSAFAFGGCLIRPLNEGILVAATDGSRFSEARIGAKFAGDWPAKSPVVLPLRTAKVVAGLLEGFDPRDPVEIAVDEARVLFGLPGGVEIRSYQAAGVFPRIDKVFPVTVTNPVAMTAGPLLGLARMASISAHPQARGVEFSFGPGVIAVDSISPDGVGARHGIPIGGGPDSTVDVTINPALLVDFLQVLDPKASIEVEVRGPREALVIRAEGGHRYALMPMVGAGPRYREAAR